MTNKQVDDVLPAREYGMLDDRRLRIGIDGPGVGSMLQQPLDAARMPRHSVAEQVVDAADAGARAKTVDTRRPFARLATLVRFRPQQLEPEGRVLTERRVVKSLRIERLRAA